MESLTSNYENLRISTPVSEFRSVVDTPISNVGSNMDGINAALDALVTGPSTPAQSPTPTTPVQSVRPSRRRESSGRVPKQPHRLQEEEPPSDSFNTAPFQNALAETQQQMRRLSDVLASSSIHEEPESTIRSLHERAVALSRFEPPVKRRVGFVGDSGVGKKPFTDFYCP